MLIYGTMLDRLSVARTDSDGQMSFDRLKCLYFPIVRLRDLDVHQTITSEVRVNKGVDGDSTLKRRTSHRSPSDKEHSDCRPSKNYMTTVRHNRS